MVEADVEKFPFIAHFALIDVRSVPASSNHLSGKIEHEAEQGGGRQSVSLRNWEQAEFYNEHRVSACELFHSQ